MGSIVEGFHAVVCPCAPQIHLHSIAAVMLVSYMPLAIIASLKKRLSLQRNSDVTRSSHPHTALLAALHAIAADRLHAIAA